MWLRMEFTKRKRDERKFTWRKVTRIICRENQEHCTRVFRKVDKEWVFEERDRGLAVKEQALRINPITAKTMLPEEYIGNCARSIDCKAQTGGMSIRLLMSWRMISRIVLVFYYPDRHDIGTQQARYYPSWKGNTEMDNHWYCSFRWLQCSQNRGLESWEISVPSIWGKENPSYRDNQLWLEH